MAQGCKHYGPWTNERCGSCYGCVSYNRHKEIIDKLEKLIKKEMKKYHCAHCGKSTIVEI